MKYHIHLDGEIQGPFTRAELEAKNLPPDTLCAAENDTAWDKLGEVLQRPEPLPLYTENTAVGTLVGGVLAVLWLGAAVFGGGMAKVLLLVGCIGVLALGVLAIVRIRNAPEFNGTPLAAIGMTLALVTMMTGLIVKPKSGRGGSSSQAKNKKEDNGKGRSGGGFGFAKAKMRANRIKCVSNIKQVSSSLKAFANDNNDRYPWLLEVRDRQAQSGHPDIGSGSENWVNETSTLFGQSAIKSNLGSAKILVSPLDPDRQGVNDGINLGEVQRVPNEGHSYGVVNGEGGSGMGADDARPGTILTVTRNISGPANGEDSLSDQDTNSAVATASTFAIWKGADKNPTDSRVMAGLNANAGQMGMSDGSASQSNDADLGQKTAGHHNELGGNYRGSPSGFLDTPND